MKTLSRRWTSFSLRTLLIVFTVLALWMGMRAERARRVRELVSAIRADGGNPLYDYEHCRELQTIGEPRPLPGPDWLRNLIGVEYFAYVEGVAYWEATDDTIRVFRPSDSIKTINIISGDVTDEGLRLLSRLQSLEDLCVQFSGEISDDGLRHIGKLKRIDSLAFNFSPNITDAGLPHLYRLKKLQYLNLIGTQCTEQGVAEIQKALPLCQVISKEDP